jgi:septal ring factor EnvC (AmiA/AmiB activator)
MPALGLGGRRALGVLLVGALTWPMVAAGAAEPNDGKTPSAAELSARRDDLQTLRGRIDRLQRDIAGSESSRREAADELRQSEQAISRLRREQRRLARERQSVEAELRRLDGESRRAGQRLDNQNAQIASLLRRQLRYGDLDPLRLALSKLPPAEASRQRLLLARIAEARTRLAADAQAGLARSRELAADTRAQRRRLDELADRQRARQEDLRAQQREHRQVVQRISRQLTQQRRTVDKLRRDERRLSDLVRKLDRLVSGRDRPAPTPRNLSRPSGGYAGFDRSSRFARQYGQLARPVAGRAARRAGELKGLFIATADGAEVVAVAAGQVVFADWLRGFGNLLVIDHGESFLSVYGNNEALLAEVGEQVAAGAPVATAGNSGGQQESGLYFELRFRGEAIDPAPWLRSR